MEGPLVLALAKTPWGKAKKEDAGLTRAEGVAAAATAAAKVEVSRLPLNPP